MVALNGWAISNGLGGHTDDLSREELNVQFKVRLNYTGVLESHILTHCR